VRTGRPRPDQGRWLAWPFAFSTSGPSHTGVLFVDRVTMTQLERGTSGAWLPSRRLSHSSAETAAMSMKTPCRSFSVRWPALLGIAAAPGLWFELSYGDPEPGVTTTRLILGASFCWPVISLLVANRLN